MLQWFSGQLGQLIHIMQNEVAGLCGMKWEGKNVVSQPLLKVQSVWQTDLEERRLKWSDTMQWLFNCIGTSQLAVLKQAS